MVKAVTYGSWRWLDFDGLWNTGHRKKAASSSIIVILKDWTGTPVPFTKNSPAASPSGVTGEFFIS